MSEANEFFDFAIFWELMFGEEDEGFECPLCQEMIKRGTRLEFVDEEDRVFLCPECESKLILDEASGMVEPYEGGRKGRRS